jgi:hypothetical protein
MKNAHLRFGWLTYARMTEKNTTHIRLRLDRFIGEVLPDPPRQAKAHFISVLGGDTQIAAVHAAIAMNEKFMVEGPGVAPIRVCLERNAQCYRGSVQLSGRKKPLRHLIGISEDFLASSTAASPSRTLLAASDTDFIWASLAHIHGLPGAPEWALWFRGQLERHKALGTALGIGCDPVFIKGDKQQFLSYLSSGIKSGAISLPPATGPISWPSVSLKRLFLPLVD